MAGKAVRMWFGPEADYLEVMFEQKPGFFRPTDNDQVTEKVDEEGGVAGFSVLRVSSLDKSAPGSCSASVAGRRVLGSCLT